MNTEGYGYIAHWDARSRLSGWALAEVIESQAPGIAQGEWVVGHLHMQQRVACQSGDVMKILEGHDPLAFIHLLGMTGFTAWVGMHLIGKPTRQDTVLVNADAGAVGSLAARLARHRGARVIVTAGRADKREWLYRQGFDDVLDHRHPDYAKHLEKAAPAGISLHFESVAAALIGVLNGDNLGKRVVKMP